MTEPVMVGGGPAAAGNKRIFIMVGVAVVLALVALVLPKLLFGSDDAAVEEVEEAPVAAAPTGGLAPEPEATEEVVAEPARTFEVFSTKNPFTPLIDTTPVASVAPTAVSPSIVAPVGVAPAPVAPVSGAAPVAAPVVVPGTTPAPATTPVPATEPGVSQRVAMLEVFVNDEGVTVASVRVNDTVHEVAEGTTFATRYKAVTLSVADGCGQFLYGDNRFRLCEGEELLK